MAVWQDFVNLADKIGANSANAPALAAYKGKLYMAYRGSEDDMDVWITTYENGTWSKIKNLNDEIGTQSTTFPSMAVFGGKLYLVYKGSEDRDLWFATFDGTSWSSITNLNDEIGARTGDGPCAVCYDNKLFVIFMDEWGPELWYTTTEDGVYWEDVRQITEINDACSITGPGGVSFAVDQQVNGKGTVSIERLFMPFRGATLDDQQVYLCHYDKAYTH